MTELPYSDEAFLARLEAIGATVGRADTGKVLWIEKVQPARLSPEDRKVWAELVAKFLLRMKPLEIVLPNPGGLLPDPKLWILPGVPDAIRKFAIKSLRYSHPEGRINRLKRHPEMMIAAADLMAQLPLDEDSSVTVRSDDGGAQLLSTSPFWVELADAEMLALAYDAAPSVTRDKRRQHGARRGGKEAASAAKVQAETWQLQAIKAAREMMDSGKARHELAAILARRFAKSARTIRSLLKKAEV